ncbi:MAG: GNAT family N-acetyltransferase [Gammaproteobacteria bacterium]|nr:GNAT family N-acetyltransferase [Gammaproteobacteria bacterium]
MVAHRFAQWFRSSSPYIKEHRDKRFVLLLPDVCLQHEELRNIARDIALLNVLSIQLLLVVQASSKTGEEALQRVFDQGLPSSRHPNRSVPLFSSNEPVLHDSMATWQWHIDRGEIVMITANTEETLEQAIVRASQIAIEMKADKLIAFHEFATSSDLDIELNSDLSTGTLRHLIKASKFATEDEPLMQSLLHVCEQGVKRAHVVSYQDDGALLTELFTADGSGTQISTDDYLTLRKATALDIDDVLQLMQTDIEQKRLVPRERELLIGETTTMFIAEHDNVPVGCVALYDLTDGMQEIGSLLAAPKHRDRNIGLRLLARAEKAAGQRGATHVYVFTKSASDWFKKHGYQVAPIDSLPALCRAKFDHERQPTLLIKAIA